MSKEPENKLEQANKQSEGLAKAANYLKYAQESFSLLDDITKIITEKDSEGTLILKLAESALETEFKKLYNSVIRGYRSSIPETFEREKFISDKDVVLLARNQGLLRFLPEDFVKSWRKVSLTFKTGQEKLDVMYEYAKNNRKIYECMLDELEKHIEKMNKETSEIEGMNCF